MDKLAIKFNLESLWKPHSLTERAFPWFIKTSAVNLIRDSPTDRRARSWSHGLRELYFLVTWVCQFWTDSENLCFSSNMTSAWFENKSYASGSTLQITLPSITHLTEFIWRCNQRYYLQLTRIKWVLKFYRGPPCYHDLVLFRGQS
jgi:hypothetical protein